MPVLGYKADEMITMIKSIAGFKVIPVFNSNYEKTNNLYSLIQAEKILTEKDFIVINGDMVFDYHILTDIKNIKGNAIAVDINEYPEQLDSPRVLIQDEHILDIGRHRNIEQSDGYAIGIYKFSSQFSAEYFEAAKQLTAIKPQAGYHEPFELLLQHTWVTPCLTRNYMWMDVDEKSDVARAEKMLLKMEE